MDSPLQSEWNVVAVAVDKETGLIRAVDVLKEQKANSEREMKSRQSSITPLQQPNTKKDFPWKAKIPFSYQLPEEDLPQTFFGTHGKIAYWVIALVQAPKPVWTMQRIVLLGNQDIRIANPECLNEYTACSDNYLRLVQSPKYCLVSVCQVN